jgi:hypothetical protein
MNLVPDPAANSRVAFRAYDPVDDAYSDAAVLRLLWALPCLPAHFPNHGSGSSPPLAEISCLTAPASARPLYLDRLAPDRLASDRLASDRLASDRLASGRLAPDRVSGPTERERLTESAKHQ